MVIEVFPPKDLMIIVSNSRVITINVPSECQIVLGFGEIV